MALDRRTAEVGKTDAAGATGLTESAGLTGSAGLITAGTEDGLADFGVAAGRARPDLRVTPLGRAMLAVAVLSAAGAAGLRYPELAVFAGGALAAILAAVVAVARSPRLTVVPTVEPSGVSRGEEARLTLTVVNRSRHPSPPCTLHLSYGPLPLPARRGGIPVGGASSWPRRFGRSHRPPGRADGPTVGGGGGAVDGGTAAGGSTSGSTCGSGTGSGGVRGGGAGGAGMVSAGEVDISVRRLPGMSSRQIELAVDTSTRGVLRIGPAQIRRSDPFGLAFRRRQLGADAVLRVRPRVYPLVPTAAAPRRDPDGQSGRGTTGGLLFHTLREYTPGEDLRMVHWATSARAGQLMVRTHIDPSEPAATVVLDTRPDAFPPGPAGAAAFEDAVDAAASVVVACSRHASSVRLLSTAGLRMTGRRRREDVEALLDELAAVRPDPAATLDVLRTLRRGSAGTLVVITGGFDRAAPAAVAPVAHVFDQVIILRMGPRSAAAARALNRRTPGERPRLRRLAAALAERGEGPGPAGPWRVTASSGRLRLVHVPVAEELSLYWPGSAVPWLPGGGF